MPWSLASEGCAHRRGQKEAQLRRDFRVGMGLLWLREASLRIMVIFEVGEGLGDLSGLTQYVNLVHNVINHSKREKKRQTMGLA